MAEFSGLKRKEMLRQMEKEEYDVLIIGGGITGAGIALDAVTRGLKVALIDMQDFAAGTSSRSTKLVHGGLRYLKQFEIKEVAELGKERAIVYENGPHVTTPEWMLLPFYQGGTFGKHSTSIGLKIYDFLARVKKAERRKMLSAAETMRQEPLVRKAGLLGGGLYVEYRTDDARLTIEIIKKAHEKGAVIANYVKAARFTYHDEGKLLGAEVIDRLFNKKFAIRAKKIVNAAGPWVDHVRDADHSKNEKHLKLSKGVHIVFDEAVFPLRQSVYFDTPDGRMVFAIPRDGKTYVGTTDTFYEGDLAELRPLKEDRDYLLGAIHYMFPDLVISEKEIESSWAGVRPLIHEIGKAPSEISRKDEIWESKSGLITIAGGKLTGYRKMAERAVNLIVRKFREDGHKEFGKCVTEHLPISGGELGGSSHLKTFLTEKAKQAEQLGLSYNEGYKLGKLYGTNIDQVFAYMRGADGCLPPSLYGQLMYAIHEEMAVTPVDFFNRRTGDLLFHIEKVKEWKAAVISEMSSIYGWTDHERMQYEKELDEEIIRAPIR